ncbi:MAG: sulfide/dihydroorotate dehydrogenase-like FAD/NAD-binding protein [Planctomycetes bacterium]|nr:sulfide/dihydroorotate dehydrogenase-like FAD/NAD-binding protein [Planctomycetota bacterium]
MFEILGKERVAQRTVAITVRAPDVARAARAGQFVILRNTEEGERYPLTIADFDAAAGTIDLVFAELGAATMELGRFEPGDAILDLVGPLGTPSEIRTFGRVTAIGGGVGIAAIHPIARALREAGNHVTSIIGARSASLLFWQNRMARASDHVLVATDDGTSGRKGLVTDILADLIASGPPIDRVVAVGPTPMMRAVAEATRPHGIRTIVSLNPIMVDGTGMCGGCRVDVGGRKRFACVDGPEFDAHLVDFEGLMARQRAYKREEEEACRLQSIADRGEDPRRAREDPPAGPGTKGR